MAKKTRCLNPADAFRKAQRQKEIKRNKLERKKAREGAQNKKNTSEGTQHEKKNTSEGILHKKITPVIRPGINQLECAPGLPSPCDQDESEEGDTEDDEEDIPLPEGSPPRDKSDEDTDEDDIPLPEGPPPPKPVPKPSHPEPLVNRAESVPTNISYPTSLPHPVFAQPQPGFPPPISLVPGVPPPPMIGGSGAMSFPLGPNGLPLPPPHIHHFHPLPPPPPSAKLPAKPETNVSHEALPNPSVAPNPKPTAQVSATVIGLPQLRDLKREATSFVPAAIRKKRKELDRRAGLAGLGDSHRIQAAPESFMESDRHPGSSMDPESDHQPKHPTTSLLAALKRDGVVSDLPASKSLVNPAGAEKDDYDKFVESLGDVL